MGFRLCGYQDGRMRQRDQQLKLVLFKRVVLGLL